MKSINVDWSGAYASGEWSFIGRDLSYTEQEQENDPDAGIPISVSNANFKLILKHLRRQLLITRARHKQRLKDIKIARKALKQAK